MGSARKVAIKSLRIFKLTICFHVACTSKIFLFLVHYHGLTKEYSVVYHDEHSTDKRHAEQMLSHFFTV